MSARFRRDFSAFLLAVAALLLCQPGATQAHPHLVGRWSAPVPPGGLMVYEFGPPQYLGNGCWSGCYSFFVSGIHFANGTYELRMYTGTQGTLGFRESLGGSTTVGEVDFTTRLLNFRNVTYRP